jgi:hypothetical protein
MCWRRPTSYNALQIDMRMLYGMIDKVGADLVKLTIEDIWPLAGRWLLAGASAPDLPGGPEEVLRRSAEGGGSQLASKPYTVSHGDCALAMPFQGAITYFNATVIAIG